jgi:hypothetical protein
VECSVLKYPASTTTECKDPDCTRTIIACTATDSTSTTTTTLTCPSPTPYDNGSPSDQIPLIGDGGDGDVVLQWGDFDIPPVTVTVTSTVTPVTTIT